MCNTGFTKSHGSCNNFDMTTKFTDYIKRLGVEQFCAKYTVKKRTAESWLREERFPSRERAIELVKDSKGELSLDVILMH